MDDLMNAVKAQLYERISSPLLSSFVISWIGWNYRFLLIVFSSMLTPDKVMYIDVVAFPGQYDVFLRGFFYPLASACALIFLYPFPAKYVYRFSRTQQKALKEIQTSIEDETPLTRDEAREIRISVRKINEEHEKELLRLRTEVIDLKDENKRLENERDIYKSSQSSENLKISVEQIDSILGRLGSTDFKALNFIGEKGSLSSMDVAMELNIRPDQVQTSMSRLLQNGLVVDNGSAYEITGLGTVALKGTRR